MTKSIYRAERFSHGNYKGGGKRSVGKREKLAFRTWASGKLMLDDLLNEMLQLQEDWEEIYTISDVVVFMFRRKVALTDDLQAYGQMLSGINPKRIVNESDKYVKPSNLSVALNVSLPPVVYEKLVEIQLSADKARRLRPDFKQKHNQKGEAIPAVSESAAMQLWLIHSFIELAESLEAEGGLQAFAKELVDNYNYSDIEERD